MLDPRPEQQLVQDSDGGANEAWKIRKVIGIPAETADPDLLSPMLKDFGTVPPLVRDINLSLDDRYLYVSCWGSVEFRQYEPGDDSRVDMGAPAPLARQATLGGFRNPQRGIFTAFTSVMEEAGTEPRSSRSGALRRLPANSRPG